MKKTILALATTSLLLSSCGYYFERYTPIEYCYYDICSNYDEYPNNINVLPYSYKEVYSKNGMEEKWKRHTDARSVYLFEVTVYLEERADIWFGGVCFNNYYTKGGYSPSECLCVDMDYMCSFEYMLEPEYF